MWETVLSEFADPFSVTSWPVALLRMSFAVLLGGLIGWEREMLTKPAGLRTHVMIALAASIFTLLTFELVELRTGSEHLRTDPIRLIEAITAGVAFLAAGSIFTAGDKVRGLTTGASMWLAGAIGVACGLGEVPLALMATALSLIVLMLLRRVQTIFGSKEPRT